MRRRLTAEQIKDEELNILLEVDKFCKENNICYCLAGGTLLGAVRHHGFIPWDDDIDICMPRKDYIRFIHTFHSENKNLRVRSNILGNYPHPFTKVINRGIRCLSTYDTSEANKYLWIDILPVDGLPTDQKELKKLYKEEDFYRHILKLCSARLGEGKNRARKTVKYILKPLALLYGEKRAARKMEKIASRYPYKSSEYVGIITWGLYGPGERMKKDEFEKKEYLSFEGHMLPVFSCWDSYLHGLYHDYMTLPPVEKRATHEMRVYRIH